MVEQAKFTTPNTAKIEEYKALRAEILQNEKIQSEVIVYSSIVTGAIFGWGFSADGQYKAYIFLIPLIVLIPALCILLAHLRSTFTIASYIKVFIEHEIPEMHWESILSEWRKEEGFGIYMSKLDPFLFGILGFYDVFCALCLLLSGLFWKDSICKENWLPFIIVLVGVVLLTFVLNVCMLKIPEYQKQSTERFEEKKNS